MNLFLIYGWFFVFLASELYVGVDKNHHKSYDFIQQFIKKEMSDCFGRERHGTD